MVDSPYRELNTIEFLPLAPPRFAFALCKGDKYKGDQLITVVGSLDEAYGIAAEKQKEIAAGYARILAAETDAVWLDLFQGNPPRPALQWHPLTPDFEASETERWHAASDKYVYFWIRRYMVQP